MTNNESADYLSPVTNNGAQTKTNNHTNMAKPTLKPIVKKTTPAVPATPAPAPAESKEKRIRGNVLGFYTPSELAELIGEDTKIGVSIKGLKIAITEATVSAKLKAVGL